MNFTDVLIVAAHPDDEILGCGATIAKHVANGRHVHILILAEGATSRSSGRDVSLHAEELGALQKAAERASKVLGVTTVNMHSFPDNRMDSVDLLDVIKVVEQKIEELDIQLVYTHHPGDLNVDHQIVHRAVMTACRPVPGQKIREILLFEVPSSTGWQCGSPVEAFVPNWFEEISDFLDLKMQALAEYQQEMRAWPHARSPQAVEHLARWRGASVGFAAAEAFVLGRRVG